VAVCKEALRVAEARKMTISVDLNYREKLWQYGERPTDVMPELVQYCNVVMGNLWATESLLGLQSTIKESKGRSKTELLNAAEYSMKQLQQDYPKVTTIAYTFRLENSYFSVLHHDATLMISREFYLRQTIDKVGSGDCFMGGLIYGLLNRKSPKEIIDYAAAAAIGKLQEKGDATNNRIDQVQTILNDHG
jgi:2-dehydro-3-deoxygluconokinase